MPEGPELRHSRDVLSSILVGKKIIKFEPTTVGRYSKASPIGLADVMNDVPFLVESVDTKGKFMWWTLQSATGKKWYIHCTYGMSGGWFRNHSNHTAFVVEFSGSGVPITRDTQMLFFNDMRHFGTIKFISSEKEHTKKLGTLGPCLFDTDLTPEVFAKRILRKPNRTIAEALMDQNNVAGVGNYLKAEALFRSGISPWRNVTDISVNEYVLLFKVVTNAAVDSYNSQGATLKTYKTVDGSTGRGQFTFMIYGKKQCPDGHQTLHEETPEGRTSWWCRVCQK